ncbi:MAG TPA: FN3 associated domain-containing protein, partial [Clostridia bacterium]|nr:FN3 associated domain-containing protein [Clostridia bacterium]
MSRTKIVLIAVIVLLIALLVACKDIKEIPKENNGTGNYPETFDLQRPVFSDVGGFYEKDFTLKIYFPDMYAVKGHNIYYTMDGSEPTMERGILYDSTKGVRIPGKLYTESNGDFVTVVRAAVFNIKGEMVGKISTATYIKTSDKESRYTMPVISLVTED